MRKREINPLAIVLLIIIGITGLVIASVIRNMPAVAKSSWSGLIFWLIFILIAGVGGFLIGKFFNKGGRR